jgi:hypothetical protein
MQPAAAAANDPEGKSSSRHWIGKARLVAGVTVAVIVFEAAIVLFLMPPSSERPDSAITRIKAGPSAGTIESHQ